MASLRNRDGIYYIQFYLAGKQRRISTGNDSLELRQFESAQHRGVDNPFPTRTPSLK